MKSWTIYVLWAAFLAFLVTQCLPAHAADNWIAASVTSYHADTHGEHYNSRNFGLGAERTDGNLSYMAGAYRNSLDRTSAYALVGYAPIELGPFRFGIAAGAVTGYPRLNNGHVGPAAVGLIRYESGRFGVNVVLIPPVEKSSPITVGLQVKGNFL